MHSTSKRFRRRLEHPCRSHTLRNPVCGDSVDLQLQEDVNGVLRSVAFEGQGCMISQAAASIICEFAEGKSIAELRQFTAEEMLELLRIPLTPRRMQCGLLAFTALKTLLYSTDERADERSVHGSQCCRSACESRTAVFEGQSCSIASHIGPPVFGHFSQVCRDGTTRVPFRLADWSTTYTACSWSKTI